MEKKCTVYQICDEIDSSNLKVCMDVTHLHCRANILKMDVREYAKEYLDEVVENQGKLFDFVAQNFSDKDTEDFIIAYMASKTRKHIDEAQAYVNTMDATFLGDLSPSYSQIPFS